MLLDALADHVRRYPDRPLPAALVDRVLRAGDLLDRGCSLSVACGVDHRRRDSALRRAAELLIDNPASAPSTAAGLVLRTLESFTRVTRAPRTEIDDALQTALSYGPVPRSQRHLARIIAG